MADQHVRRSGEDYAEIFAGALPTGPAWPRDPDSIPMRIVDGLMRTWGDVDGRIDDLLTRESDPRFTFEMLPDWEAALGLPDPCLTEPETIPDRRTAVVNRLTIEGGQSRAFFIGAAAAIGYTISIYEYLPVVSGITRCGETRPDGTLTLDYFRCGVSRCGLDPLCRITMTGGDEWIWQLGPPELRYFWKVKILNTRVTWLRCGTGICGQDHMAEIALATDLECIIRRWSPAHSVVIFDYSQVDIALGDGSLDFSNRFNSGELALL
jgi:uncharacterized protein YmfQ (DUF2313 family)